MVHGYIQNESKIRELSNTILSQVTPSVQVINVQKLRYRQRNKIRRQDSNRGS